MNPPKRGRWVSLGGLFPTQLTDQEARGHPVSNKTDDQAWRHSCYTQHAAVIKSIVMQLEKKNIRHPVLIAMWSHITISRYSCLDAWPRRCARKSGDENETGLITGGIVYRPRHTHTRYIYNSETTAVTLAERPKGGRCCVVNVIQITCSRNKDCSFFSWWNTTIKRFLNFSCSFPH